MRRAFMLAALLPLAVVAAKSRAPLAPEAIAPNDNRHSAGTLKAGVLTIALEARPGSWRPEGDSGKALDVGAFAEVGKALTTPGPMIRVPVGTQVRATLRNKLNRNITVFGFGKTRGMSDSVVIAANAEQPLQFTATAPGTYYYMARSGLNEIGARKGEDGQLNGVIIVDPAGVQPPPNERVFTISWYFTVSKKSKTGLGVATMAINGLSWPHTEKLAYTQGDSVHWRVVNLTDGDHPMHLHGFYFRLESSGNGVSDTTFTPTQTHMAVTEIAAPFSTISLSWKADRPGNWIYHCHYAGHLSADASLDTHDGIENAAMQSHHMSDRPHQMFGLVMGISIAPTGVAAVPAANPRKIRIVQRVKPNVYGTQPGMSFIVDGSPESKNPNAMPVPGPTLVLERGQPVAVTIVNQSDDHATIHWHGIELESYPDGVPGWSGSGANILPAIKPHDSLTVRWTPPRAGTFMYHSHFNEFQQMGRGLYGPIVVLEPGQKFDPETDRILFFGTAGIPENVLFGPFPNIIMNGKEQPDAMNLKAGTKYRFRLFNLADGSPTMVSLNAGAKPAMWRAIAKDGYPLQASQAVSKPAALIFDPGEIYDFEYTSATATELNLKFGIPPFLQPPPPKPGDPPPPRVPPTITVPVHVR